MNRRNLQPKRPMPHAGPGLAFVRAVSRRLFQR